ATKEIAVNQDAQGFEKNKTAAKTGGRIAGDARKELELESGKSVISKTNFIDQLKDASIEQYILESDE
nr:hypothetical protein [Chlamydiota bacterium]